MSEFVHSESGRVLGAPAGSALEEQLIADGWTRTDDGATGPEPVGLADMSVKQLRQVAAEREVELGDAARKQDILALLDDSTGE